MDNYAEDIRKIAQQKKSKGGLVTAADRLPIDGESHTMTIAEDEADEVANLVSPLTLEVLTYDDTLDVDIEANNGTFTVKTAETAQVIDANGTIWAIDTIIYP